MAKGQSTFRQLGKIDGRKYYQVKGVDGIVSQSINQGMSNRVKNDAAYANTRLNNAEFGGAGSTAGAITRALSQKWRYLLVPFATGKLAKDIREIMMKDTTGKWGQRGLIGTAWQAILAEKVTSYSKNSFDDYSGATLVSQFDSEEGLQLHFSVGEALHNEKLEALGCTGVRVVGVEGKISASSFDTAAGRYNAAVNEMVVVEYADIDFGDNGSLDDALPQFKVTAQADNTFYGAMFIMLPYKEVNGEQYIMQEHCSFKMIAAE